MHLERILPAAALRYIWEPYVGAPPITPALPRRPLSRQAWLSIGTAAIQVPSGAIIAAQAPLLDGTRGILSLWADWFPSFGGTGDTIQIAALDAAGPDAIPPTFVFNPANAAAGRIYIQTGAVETVAQVATEIAGKINAMLGLLGTFPLWQKFQGIATANDIARADLGNGTVALVSPRPWRATQLQSVSGCWNTVDETLTYVERPGTLRPILTAGCRPAPWEIHGDDYPGKGIEHSIIG